MWKGSVISFQTNCAENLLKLEAKIHSGEYKALPDNITYINERGKVRKIHSQHISDRIVHKIVNQDILIPTFHKRFIRQNTASQTGKGMDFAMRTMKCHLNRVYRKWGKDFFVLSIDMKSYFESIPHWYIEKLLREKITDERILKLCMEPFRAYENGKGLGLGSEINQTYALLCLNEFDHIIKERFRIKEYARYMDDMYLMHNDKAVLMEILEFSEQYFSQIDLKMNDRKTNIFPAKNGITFLGFRWRMTETGHVIVTPKKQTIIRNKKKLRKLKQKVVNGEFTLPEILNSYASIRGHIQRGNCRKTIEGMDRYFYKLIGRKEYGR